MTALYRNPIARDGDFADPFVLRHDGRYYLYATNPDIRCWSSTDLLTWTLEGPTIAPDVFPGLVPFAPEVIYADGAFFMYTSPSGHGHHVLRAEAPTGPFELVTGNVGHAIDGNVFVDDDGRTYFYWAGDEGIWGCEMPSPTEFGAAVFTGITMHGWTEGPYVSKRDGVYQMTLTGNHYLSRGYRIDAAWSDDPLTGYRPSPLNPILVGADGPATGLGHSSSVVGPDLVSTWIVYHNIYPDASRDLDLDRQVGVGPALMALGPSTSAPAPGAPDAVWSGDDPAPALPPGPFTAELNLTASADASAFGITIGDGPTVRVDPVSGMVTVSGIAGAVPLPRGFAPAALHTWTLESDGEILRIRLDGRAQSELPAATLSGSVVPFAEGGTVRVGFCALTASTPAIADRDAVKIVPGRFWADAGADGLELGPGDVRAHPLHVQDAGAVGIHVSGSFTAGDEIVVAVDGIAHALRAPRSTRVVATTLDLSPAARLLELRGVAGRPVVALVTVVPASPTEAAAFTDQSQAGWGKHLVDASPWADVSVTAEVTVEFEAADGHADLLLRASQLAEGGEGDDPVLGTDFLLGYSVQLHPDRIVLARHAYDNRVLATAEVAVGDGPHTLLVSAVGSELAVEFDGVEVLRADDEWLHVAGGVGLRTADARLHVASLRIVPAER
jgi:hypothetical protein